LTRACTLRSGSHSLLDGFGSIEDSKQAVNAIDKILLNCGAVQSNGLSRMRSEIFPSA